MQFKSNYTMFFLPLSLPPPPVFLKTNKNKMKENEQKQPGEKREKGLFGTEVCYITVGFPEKNNQGVLPLAGNPCLAPWDTWAIFGVSRNGAQLHFAVRVGHHLDTDVIPVTNIPN